MGDDDPHPASLYHDTDARGIAAVLATGRLRASTIASNPSDVRCGPGQYLSDVEPGTKTPAQLSRLFLGQPFQGNRFGYFIEIDVSGLQLIRGRPGVWLVPNDEALDLAGRIVRHGPLPAPHH